MSGGPRSGGDRAVPTGGERKTWRLSLYRSPKGVTSAFYGLYLLADRRDLAERIEPTARRRAGLPEPEDTPKPPAPTPPQDPEKPA